MASIRMLVLSLLSAIALRKENTMAEGQKHADRTGDKVEETDETTTPVAGANDVAEDADKLLDEIDDVLEENAEDFVAQFVQKGGE
jgi:ubiquitin-like protein Pup